MNKRLCRELLDSVDGRPPEMVKIELKEPIDWSPWRQVHDWRDAVPESIYSRWNELSHETKAAVYLMAVDRVYS